MWERKLKFFNEKTDSPFNEYKQETFVIIKEELVEKNIKFSHILSLQINQNQKVPDANLSRLTFGISQCTRYSILPTHHVGMQWESIHTYVSVFCILIEVMMIYKEKWRVEWESVAEKWKEGLDSLPYVFMNYIIATRYRMCTLFIFRIWNSFTQYPSWTLSLILPR